jgi:hypothetical protein
MAEHPYGVSDQHIAIYRAKAEECRQWAENSLTPADKRRGFFLAMIGQRWRRKSNGN